jgi:hypothetical protein
MDTTKLNDEHEQQVAMLHVFTTEQKPAEGQETVVARTRNGKNEDGSKREVANENRLRCIVIPELTVDGIPSKFQSLVMSALRELAVAQLSSIWKQEPMVKEVPAAIWTVDSLLLFAAREAESKRLTKETLGAWFDESDLCKRIMDKKDAKLLTKWKELILGVAAPTFLETQKNCESIISSVSVSESDAESIIGRQIIAKANKRIVDLNRQVEEIESV